MYTTQINRKVQYINVKPADILCIYARQLNQAVISLVGALQYYIFSFH